MGALEILFIIIIILMTLSCQVFTPCGDKYLDPSPAALSGTPNTLELLLIIIIDRFYIALFSAFEQTHCARM